MTCLHDYHGASLLAAFSMTILVDTWQYVPVTEALTKPRAMTQRFDKASQSVKDAFSLPTIFGVRGAQFLQALGTSALGAIANGASVRIWSDPTPLCVATVLVNAAHSRKSQTTVIANELGLV